MRLARALLSLMRARLPHWNTAWRLHASPIDNAALAALVALATYKLLGLF